VDDEWLNNSFFVSGATGFIGGRLCERLVQAGAHEVRALVHTAKKAPRIARLPIKLVPGDLLNPTSLVPAVGNASVVIHCGLGEGRDIVRGTRNLLELAKATRIARFIHISTAAVYGLSPPLGSETEDAPLPRTKDTYCHYKARSEKLVTQYSRRGVPSVILRPSIVYGPYSSWSTRMIDDLLENRVSLIDGGAGICNTTYVDNLIDAIFLSIKEEAAIGKTFFITDGERITWADFIRAHVAMTRQQITLPVRSVSEILAAYRLRSNLWSSSCSEAVRVLFSPELRKLLRRIPLLSRLLVPIWESLERFDARTGERLRSYLLRHQPLPEMVDEHLPPLTTLEIQTSKVFFSIQKARNTIGYEPRIPFTEGMRRVEEWLRFANYL